MTGVMTWRVRPRKAERQVVAVDQKIIPLEFWLAGRHLWFCVDRCWGCPQVEPHCGSPRTHGLSARTDLFPGLVWLGRSPAGAFDRYIEDQGGDGGSNTREMVT